MKLVFETWQQEGQDIYSDFPELSMGPFHAGSVFDCEINLSSREKKELKEAIKKGFTPVFQVISDE